MSEEVKERITNWLRQTPPVRGALVRGIRFTDQTFICDFDSRDFPMSALEQAWRSVADTFQVLAAQRLPPTQLVWVYERAVLHCVRRDDGAILGIFVSKKLMESDRAGLERAMGEFLSLDANGNDQTPAA
jgi:hypothetical protein